MISRTKKVRATAIGAIVLAGLLIAGCGGGAPTGPEAEVKRGVFTTAVDCADAGLLDYEACAAAMAQAVKQHETDAPTYGSLRSCVAKEGDGRCEYTALGKYRPRLLAFLVTASKPPTAVPLYAHPDGAAGFRDLSSHTYTDTDDTLTFSEHAQTMFEANATRRR